LPDLHRDIDRQLVTDSDRDAFAAVSLEARIFHRDGVGTRHQQRENIVAAAVGGSGEANAGVGIQGLDLGADNHRVGRIRYAPEQVAAGLLRRQRQNEAAKQNDRQAKFSSKSHAQTPQKMKLLSVEFINL
jgi:hypothetical protein